MYLIIERTDGVTYSYFENKKQFKVAQKERESLNRLDPNNLNHECELSLHGDNFYMVIPVKKKKLSKV